MTVQIPFYGSKGIFTMASPVWITPWTGTVTTEPANKAAAIALIAGTKSQATYTVSSTGMSSGEYFIFNTPQNRYCFYNTTDAAIPTTIYDVKIAITATTVLADLTAEIYAKAKLLDDVVVSTVPGTSVTMTATQGGVCDANYDAATYVVAGTLTTGDGVWGKVGKLADDINVTPEEVTVMDSEKEDNQIGAKYTVEFSLMNVNARALEILKNDWNNQKVNIAFVDETNDNYPMYVLFNQTLTILPDLMNRDGARIKFKATKQYKDWGTYIKFWDFSDEV